MAKLAAIDSVLTAQFDRCRLFLVLPIQSGIGVMQRHLAIAGPSEPALHIDAGRYSGKNAARLWQEKPLKLGRDLHPALAEALGFRRTDDQPIYWQLDNSALEAINRRIALPDVDGDRNPRPSESKTKFPPGFGLAAVLSKAACTRLGQENTIVPLRIAAVNFYMSQTRLGQLVVEVSCGTQGVSADLAIEILHFLSHVGQSDKSLSAAIQRVTPRGDLLKQAGGSSTAHSFSLHQLALGLACPERDIGCIVAVPRVFSYALATTSGAMAEGSRQELAARLARRMTADYSPADALGGVEFAASFRTITHACSIDGGAALVSEAESVTFLHDFADNVGPSVYLNLALLANKNMHDLVALSQGSVLTYEHSDRTDEAILDAKLDKLEQVEVRLLNYRLAHRFSIAGFGANQNLVHLAWRRATYSEQLLKDVTDDVALASACLGAAREQIRQDAEKEANELNLRNASWLKAGLTFLAALEGMHALSLILVPLLHRSTAPMAAAERIAKALNLKLPPMPPLASTDYAFEFAPLIVALLAAIAVGYFSRKTDI